MFKGLEKFKDVMSENDIHCTVGEGSYVVYCNALLWIAAKREAFNSRNSLTTDTVINYRRWWERGRESLNDTFRDYGRALYYHIPACGIIVNNYEDRTENLFVDDIKNGIIFYVNGLTEMIPFRSYPKQTEDEAIKIIDDGILSFFEKIKSRANNDSFCTTYTYSKI